VFRKQTVTLHTVRHHTYGERRGNASFTSFRGRSRHPSFGSSARAPSPHVRLEPSSPGFFSPGPRSAPDAPPNLFPAPRVPDPRSAPFSSSSRLVLSLLCPLIPLSCRPITPRSPHTHILSPPTVFERSAYPPPSASYAHAHPPPPPPPPTPSNRTAPPFSPHTFPPPPTTLPSH